MHAQQFEAFMKNHQNMVFSIAMRLTANRSEAEDISQEVFLKAYEHFDQIQNSPTAPGWLKTVATNLSLNHLSRYRSRWKFFSELANPDSDSQEQEFPAIDSIEDQLNRSDTRELVEEALLKLPDTQRVPIVLYHLEGLKYEDIASKLGITLGKVKTDIFRGREALRKKLRLKLQPGQAGLAS
jgi:RNA polymerase sigma-70 factor (ECF subfamily)